MRMFYDSNPGTDLQGDESLRFKATQAYIECEWEGDDGFYVAYLIPFNDHSLVVAANWCNALDGIDDYLQSDSQIQLMANTWPKLTQLLAAGVNEQYSCGCLRRINDYDNGNASWMVCTVIGNLDLSTIEGFFSERVMDGCRLVFDHSCELAKELSEKQPDHWGHFGKNALLWTGKIAASIALASLFGVSLDE